MAEVISLAEARKLLKNGEELGNCEVSLGNGWQTFQRGGQWVLWKNSIPTCFVAGVQNPTGNVNNAKGFTDFNELLEFWYKNAIYFDNNPGEVMAAHRAERVNLEDSWG